MNNLIDRQAAIDALYDWSEHSMTDAEAWHIRQVIGDIKSMPSAQPEPPTDDTISRQAAIDALKNRWKKTRNYEGNGDDIAEECELYLKQVPSAQPEPCEDAVSRNAIIQKLNTMDRYVSEELILCDTDKKFPKNEVFIVDDVYEEIVENLPSAQPDLSGYSDRLWKAAYERGKAEAQADIIHCGECKYYGDSDGCFFSTATTGADGFCHWAERKDGEADEDD